MNPLIECVPNISEGRDLAKIEAIAHAVETVDGVKLLDIDPGRSTNRTVITFVGEPEPVVEAAFRLIKKAAELIDMRYQKGEHPRMGATDVCPLIPLSGINMEGLIPYAHRLGKRIGEELGIPGYFYEAAAIRPERVNLAYCRLGEYEGLAKLKSEKGKPDFGPADFNDAVKRTGATAISVRDFLVAYNINLNTTSAALAGAIAADIRESGRVKKAGNPLTGKTVLDENGVPVRIPGSLKAVKGIGWYIEEYGIAQLSLNITNINITPVHVAFDEARKNAQKRKLRVTGSEIVGLVPLKALLDAADYFLLKQNQSTDISEKEKIEIAIKSLGLDDLAPFDPDKKIIEYLVRAKDKRKLIDLDLGHFSNAVSSATPLPGGGSVSAYCGALGIALGTMSANLSAAGRGREEQREYFEKMAEKGEALKQRLLSKVDEDAEAYSSMMKAFKLSKVTDSERAIRKKAIADAARRSVLIPLEVARIAFEGFAIIEAMVSGGNPTSATDAAVGALHLRSAIQGSVMNIRINLKGFEDKSFADKALQEAEKLNETAGRREREITQKLREVLGV